MLAGLMTACREADGPAGPSANDARIYLSSSPNGAAITIDGRETGQLTPDTVALRRGDRTIELRLDSAGFTYDYAALVEVTRTDTVVEVKLPLGLQCLSQSCFAAARVPYDAAGLRFAASAVGTLMHWANNSDGLLWPGNSTNNYVASGMPAFAAIADGVPVSLGAYDHSMLVGLPAPNVTSAGGAFRLTQQTWILPPPTSQVRPGTVRGILVSQEVTADDAVPGVLVVRLTYRNVSADTMVHRFSPHIPDPPVTYTDAWIGFTMDPDIGAPSDDWVSYDTDLSMVFAYDEDFLETAFIGDGVGAPGLVGLRVLSAPEGASVMLNAWSVGSDWQAGTVTEGIGFGMLTGSQVFAPDHPDARIGFLPPTSRDVRMSVTAGPFALAPGDEAEIVIAVAVAAPSTGTFTAGEEMTPGEPLDEMRPLYSVAAGLRARMIAAEGMAGN